MLSLLKALLSDLWRFDLETWCKSSGEFSSPLSDEEYSRSGKAGLVFQIKERKILEVHGHPSSLLPNVTQTPLCNGKAVSISRGAPSSTAHRDGLSVPDGLNFLHAYQNWHKSPLSNNPAIFTLTEVSQASNLPISKSATLRAIGAGAAQHSTVSVHPQIPLALGLVMHSGEGNKSTFFS